MKILMISNHLGVQSGVQRYVQNLLLNLDLTRYQVDLFVGLCPPDQASCAPALEAAGVHIIAVPDHKKARIRALYQHLKTHKDYDIIHYHTASKIGAAGEWWFGVTHPCILCSFGGASSPQGEPSSIYVYACSSGFSSHSSAGSSLASAHRCSRS